VLNGIITNLLLQESIMGLPQLTHHITSDEFIEWELQQMDRHQFYESEIFAMAGGTAEHNAAAGAIYSELRRHLKGTPCRVFMSDIRVRAAENYFYPDVVISCTAKDTENPKLIELVAPKCVIEVLSPSTAAFDRGLKFGAYREIDSLEEYLLLDPEAKTAELFRKNAAGIWELHPSTLAKPTIQLNSVSWMGQVGDVFEY
jgi:Uma2 family endonuclease